KWRRCRPDRSIHMRRALPQGRSRVERAPGRKLAGRRLPGNRAVVDGADGALSDNIYRKRQASAREVIDSVISAVPGALRGVELIDFRFGVELFSRCRRFSRNTMTRRLRK